MALINAPGNGVADDKGIYYFVPKMIKYYLDEDAIVAFQYDSPIAYKNTALFKLIPGRW